MSVFKAYLKVLIKNSTAIFVYILVFLLIAVLNSRSISNEYKNDLESKKISIGIINESDSVESEKLEKYLEENFNEKKVIKDTEKNKRGYSFRICIICSENKKKWGYGLLL